MLKFVIVFLFFRLHSIQCLCPPSFILQPCRCSDDVKQGISIVCEHLHQSFVDLSLIFTKLSSYQHFTGEETNFELFLLSNTSVEYLPENVFSNVTFKTLQFRNNRRLTTIDRNAFWNSQDRIEVLETLNTNLSDTDTIFFIIKQLSHLRYLSLQNDRLKFIPNYAFNHSNLTHIYFGMEQIEQSQPIESIGDYAFYNLPNLQFLRIFSSNLRQISKYAFAQRYRYDADDRRGSMLELYLGGKGIHSKSFPITSLTRFRNRFVFLRLYNTSITYFDERVFQPFLESNPSSLLDINTSNTLFRCDCQSAWIQNDYFKHHDQLENRVYGYPCWDYQFPINCTRTNLFLCSFPTTE